MLTSIEEQLIKRKDTIDEILNSLVNYIYTASVMFYETLSNNGKIIIFDDFKNSTLRLEIENKIIDKFIDFGIGLPAVALTQNCFDYLEDENRNKLIEKKLETVINKKDLLLGISFDGYDKTVLKALALGKNLGCRTVGISGTEEGALNDFCDLTVSIPSNQSDIVKEITLSLMNIIIDTIQIDK